MPDGDKMGEILLYVGLIVALLVGVGFMIAWTKPDDCPAHSVPTYTRSGWYCTVKHG